MTKATIVAIEIVDTVAIRSPAMIAGVASGSSTLHEGLPACEAHAARRLERIRRHGAQPLDHVAVEDEERVRHERDLDGRDRETRERNEQLEEREARDRVEEVGEDADRRVEQPVPHADECEQEREREADPTAISESSMCWTSAG